MQVYPYSSPKLNNDKSNDILKTQKIPDKIANTLKTSCYDCHSNEVKLPWYSNIAPIKWLVYNDIKKGLSHLNFSNWGKMSPEEQADALYDISEEVMGRRMPIPIYTIMHSEAKLSTEDRKTLSEWAENYANEL